MTKISKNLSSSKKDLQKEVLDYRKRKKAGDLCPMCRIGRLTIRKGRHGFFLGCTRWPMCKYLQDINL